MYGCEAVDAERRRYASCMRIMSAESYALYADLIDDEAAPLDPHVRPRIAAGRDIGSQSYLEALHRRETMKARFAAAMDGVDALLTPTTMTTAVPLDEVDQTKAPAHYTRFVNYLDLTALALPNGCDANGLPTSLQIVCRWCDEATALRIGWALEQATGWHARRPSMPPTPAPR
jgi:aspartyl-tRNA(Asn)/glutamyl-tRNA(Gln) amidotransferase subunit A